MQQADSASLTRQRIGFTLGVLLFVAILLAPTPEGMTDAGRRTAAIAAMMAAWWMSEATHIAVTALLPVGLYPLLGIMSAQQSASYYANHIVFLFIGGFVIALGMERWNLHRRIALNVIKRAGGEPARLTAGFMIATAALSMWISNTATTMMMLPIAMAVVNQLAELAEVDGRSGKEASDRARASFGVILLLAIAYSASVGGIGTIIGSPTTVAFLGFVQEAFPEYPPIAFVDWMMVCIPIVVVFLPIAWVYLCRFAGDLPLSRIQFRGGESVIASELARMGPMSPQEKKALAVTTGTALLWVFRRPITLGGFTLPGWSEAFSEPSLMHDSTVAIAMAVLLFLVPARTADGKAGALMDWETAARGIPWGIVFLLGGGFALAGGIQETDLALWIGSRLAGLEGTPVWLLVPLACLLAALLTEATSNVATVLMLSPVIAATAVEIGIHPYLLLIPTAIMASFAFMLPVATPPNAIVFSSGWITMPRMFRVGLILDLIALIVVPLFVYVLGGAVFGFGG